jgi:hypothetical protein
MPNKAKLVLREITTTTVTEDELKSSPLTFQQIDSNFLNLRDQTIGIAGDDSTTINLSAGNTLKIAGAGTVTTAVSGNTLTITGTGGSGSAQGITVVGDDSTGTLIADGETVKIAGAQNITTAVSGDTLTITGPNLSSYATQSYVTSQGYITNSPLTIVGDDSTGTILNTGETIKIAGASNITTAVSGDILTITGPNLSSYATTTYVDNKVSANNTLTIADDTSTTGSIDLDNTLQVLGGNNITTSISGGTLTITGDKSIDVNEINSGDSSAIQINDAVNISGTLNAKTIVTNDLISEDSSAINVLDGMNVSGTLSADVLDVNELSSNDSTAIQINDAVNISGATTINNTLAVTGDITTADSLQFDTTSTETVATGKLYYNSDYGTLAHGLGDGSEIIDGVDLVAYVTNAEATTLVKGEVVYIFGATGDRPSVKRADNSGDPTSSKTLGIVKNNITSGSAGYVKTQGIVTGLNLGSYTAGDIVWLGTSGAFTATKPPHPAHLVFVGVVLRANAGNGLLYVKPQNGYELDELHDVDVSTAVANDILKYDGTAWFNVPGGELIYNGNSITAASNADIDLTAGGTGNINLNADTIRLGDAGANVLVTVNGAGNLDIYHELNVTNFPQTPSSGNSNWAGYDSPTYVGTRQLYSNLTQGNITDPTERVRANTRFTVIKHPNDSTTYNDNDYVIQNTDFTVVDINGQNFAQTSRGAGARGEANNCVLINTAGGTKTGTNINGGSAFVEVDSGHGGDLTCANAMGFRSFLSNRADTGEFTRITNAYGFVAEGIGTGGTGANGTNRFVTNEYGYFSQGATGTSLVTNYYGFFANTGANATNKYAFYSASDDYLSRLGTIERTKDKVNALTAGATVSVDTDLAPIHTITLNQNTTFSFTNLSTGQTVTLIIRQDATGSRTGTFTGVIFAGGTPTLSTAANAIDVVRIVRDGTSNLGIIDKAFA